MPDNYGQGMLPTELAPEAVVADSGSTIGPDEQHSLWGNVFRRLRTKVSFWFGSIVLLVMIFIAIFPGAIAHKDPRASDLSSNYQSPSGSHWFGTDQQGYDYFAQVIYGARNSLSIGILAVIGVLVIGTAVGVFAGFYGGWVDSVLARITDIFFGIPLVLGATIVLTVNHDRTIWMVALAMVAFGWMTAMRLVRASVVAIKDADFVQAARALGVSTPRILWRHILPNAIGPVIVYATITIGILIALEATLTFLGLGLQKPALSWGLQINTAQADFKNYPYLVFFPAAFLSMTVLAFMALGDALREALDPRSQR